ncbi:Fungal specific transcription factor domain-containing protein [Cladophialophora immunda]|nr:Fungal specific transcription factor domain-containing protein [Cladophialophora immunda]
MTEVIDRLRQRAGRACDRCHSKKIKCIFTVRNDAATAKCQNCIGAQTVCHLRPSNRGRRRRRLLPLLAPNRLEPHGIALFQDHGEPERPSPDDFEGHHRVEDDSHLLLATYPIADDARDQVSPASTTFNAQTSSAGQRVLNVEAGDKSTPATKSSDLGPGLTDDDNHKRQDFQSYLGDSGCMQIFGVDNAENHSTAALLVDRHSDLDNIPHPLMQSYLETYLKYIYLWCPVLDTQMLQASARNLSSPMLRHAIALCGTHLRPPLIAHTTAADHYRRAKGLFYANHPDNPLSQLCAIMLFHWYRLDQPNLISMDSNWWWIGTAVRLAQQMGLHRELGPGESTRHGGTPALRRRIWWTLFTRDRIAALAQGRPIIVDTDSCDVRMVTCNDFPEPEDLTAVIFVHWVRLWDVAGQITKELSRRRGDHGKGTLATELINWVQSLPTCLQLPVGDLNTLNFNRDVYYLHLGYLTVVTLLHFTKGRGSIPRASIPAIAAASGIARIFNAYLSRGTIRVLGCEASWYCSVAILALLHAQSVEGLASNAEADICILRVALKELSAFSNTAQMFNIGIERLLRAEAGPASPSLPRSLTQPGNYYHSRAGGPDDSAAADNLEWMDYFPNVTAETSTLMATLLVKHCMAMPFPEIEWPDDVTLQLYDLFRDIDVHSDGVPLF